MRHSVTLEPLRLKKNYISADHLPRRLVTTVLEQRFSNIANKDPFWCKIFMDPILIAEEIDLMDIIKLFKYKSYYGNMYNIIYLTEPVELVGEQAQLS